MYFAIIISMLDQCNKIICVVRVLAFLSNLETFKEGAKSFSEFNISVEILHNYMPVFHSKRYW